MSAQAVADGPRNKECRDAQVFVSRSLSFDPQAAVIAVYLVYLVCLVCFVISFIGPNEPDRPNKPERPKRPERPARPGAEGLTVPKGLAVES